MIQSAYYVKICQPGGTVATHQVWISKSKQMQPIIEEARRTFPDAASDSQALTRALFHWYHGRQDNSKRGALGRIEEKQDKTLEYLEILLELTNNDTDHA